MTTNILMIQDKIHQVLTDKYLMHNQDWSPFGDLNFDLGFIPEVYHVLFTRTIHISDPLHDLMCWVSECEARNI
jgi:hypothetical protein